MSAPDRIEVRSGALGISLFPRQHRQRREDRAVNVNSLIASGCGVPVPGGLYQVSVGVAASDVIVGVAMGVESQPGQGSTLFFSLPPLIRFRIREAKVRKQN